MKQSASIASSAPSEYLLIFVNLITYNMIPQLPVHDRLPD